MPNTTGSFQGATDLLNKINTFLTANGWTKLRGETDIVPASPKAARYWRILILESVQTFSDYRSLQQVELRTTAGGANVATSDANWSASNAAIGPSLATGGTPGWRTGNIRDNWAWVQYDFGTPTIVREAVISCHITGEAPLNFFIQWSNDGETWMTMEYYSSQSWAATGATNTYTWDSGAGFTSGYHLSSTVGRRSGWLRDTNEGETRNQDSEGGHNYWSWQGPGYDADRRVYIHALSFSNETGGTDNIMLDASLASDITGPMSTYLDDQEGGLLANGIDPPTLAVDSNSCTYWLYLNSSRLIVVTKSGVDDYTSAYVGFLAAFAQPDDYPFPLYVGATHNDRTILISDTVASYRDFADPGRFGAYCRLWDNTWLEVANHDEDQGRVNDPRQFPPAYTWPYHAGVSGRDLWPNNTIGDYTDYDAHWIDRLVPTDQGDLPLWPVIVFSKTHGNIGALDGVFAAAQGGVLSPEQVLTISTVDYRVFRVRGKSGGMVYWAVRED